MTSSTVDLSLPGDGELRATVTGAGGIDPWTEQAKIADGRPVDISDTASVFARSGAEMDQAYLSSGGAHTTLAASFRNNGSAVLDRDSFYGGLPGGFRDSGTQLAEVSRSLHVVAQDLTGAMEQAGVAVRALVEELAGKRRDWHARVEAANPIPLVQVGSWLADRDTVAAGMASVVGVAGGAVGKVIAAYESSVHHAVRVLADHGHVPLERVNGVVAPGTEYAGAVDPATLGTPPGAGTAADPVNTGTGNFVEVDTDLEFGALVSGLSWSRVYNSRSERTGPFGPRWSSWASARLNESSAGAELWGPDGGRLFFPVDGNGFRSLHTDARIERDPAGLSVCWPDGRRWSFDRSGRPAGISSGPGTEVRFVHDRDGQLVELVHSGGRRVTVSWEHGLITAVEGGDRRVDYRYARGHLAWAGERRYGVDVDGLLATVTDADAVVELVNTYDDAGRVVAQLTPFGRTVRFSYEPGGVTVTSDDTGGPRNTFLHDPAGRLIGSIDGHGHTTALRRDPAGRIVEIVDRAGAVTTQEWDERGRLRRRLPPSGVLEEFGYDDLDRPIYVFLTGTGGTRARTVFTYTGGERTPSEIEDPQGATTRLAVHNGLVGAVTDPDGVTVRLTHDPDGALITATDAAGGVARIERDAGGRPVAACTPSGRRSRFGYDTRGLLVSRTDPDGAVWRFEHSAAGRPTAVIDPLGGRTEYRHGRHGERTDIIDALGAATTSVHDPFGNICAVTTGDGAKQTFRHDALSRLSAWTDPAGGTWLREHDREGRATASVDPDGVRVSAEFDASGQVTAVHDGLTGATFDHDEFGRTIAHVRPDATALHGAYDRCGRLLTQTDPEGGVTRYTYSPAGRLLRTVSPAGRVTTVTYDVCGRPVARSDGANGRWLQRHDADGLLVEQTSAAGLVETFTHDPCGRVLTHTAPGIGVTAWEYDAAGNVVAVTDRAGRRTFTRDLLGRMVAATDALGHTTTYTHDPAGHVVAITDPLGEVWSRSYDDNGRLVASTDPLDNLTSYGYDGAGRLTERRDATGAVVRYAHDTSGRVSSVGGDVDITIERDTLGRPIRITEPGVPEIGLGYDRNGRLTERRSGERALRWTYDPDGLPTGRTHPDSHTNHPRPRRRRAHRRADPSTARPGRARPRPRRPPHRATRHRRHPHLDPPRRPDQHLPDRRTDHPARTRPARPRHHHQRRRALPAPDLRHRRTAHRRRGLVVPLRPLRPPHPRDRPRPPAPRPHLRPRRPPHPRRNPGIHLRRRRAAHQRLHLRRAGPPHPHRRHPGHRRRPGRTRRRRRHPTAVGHHRPTVPARPDRRPHSCRRRPPLGRDPPEHLAHPDWQHSIGGSPLADPWGGARPDLAPGYRGELAVDGLIWLRHRTYDPATRAFTTPDPWPAVPATPYAANPYHYAGNDPINQIDPLGLRPVTDTDIAAQKDDGGLFGAVGDWFGENWEYIAGGAMVVAGVGLMFTGVGGAAGLALLGASGAMFTAGSTTILQKSTTGNVDWRQVGVEGAVGFGTGAAGGAIAAGAGRLVGSARAVGIVDPAPVRATMVADARGTVIPTSRSALEQGFRDAGIPTFPTRSPGMGYALPDGSTVRVMEASGSAPIRASFGNSNTQPVTPFTGKPPQRPKGWDSGVDGRWKDRVIELTHLDLEP